MQALIDRVSRTDHSQCVCVCVCPASKCSAGRIACLPRRPRTPPNLARGHCNGNRHCVYCVCVTATCISLRRRQNANRVLLISICARVLARANAPQSRGHGPHTPFGEYAQALAHAHASTLTRVSCAHIATTAVCGCGGWLAVAGGDGGWLCGSRRAALWRRCSTTTATNTPTTTTHSYMRRSQ